MATRVKPGPPPSARPTGTVTFLFSDIEGSTARWEGSPEAMELALARHDALVRGAIEAQGGYVFKTVGDAFCVVFARASDALVAALGAQRALGAEDFSAVEGIRVRMALHTGQSAERDGDYFGPAVNRVARLLAIAHGGQVLVSGITAELVHSELPPQSSLRDLGAHRLKDLAQPEQVYQLIAPDLPEAFPALLSLNHLSHNLSENVSTFYTAEITLPRPGRGFSGSHHFTRIAQRCDVANWR
jgi:class 3 adenylate cyclase